MTTPPKKTSAELRRLIDLRSNGHEILLLLSAGKGVESFIPRFFFFVEEMLAFRVPLQITVRLCTLD